MADLNTVADALEAVGDRSGRTLLVARGRVRANPPRAREFILDVTEGAPEELYRGWHALSDQEALARDLPAKTVRVGGIEPGLFWWTTDDGPVQVWDPEGLLWRVGRDLHRVRPEGRWLADDVKSVQAYVGEDWVEQGVRLRLKGGGTIPVAVTQNDSVTYDMTYDGLSLDWDTSWCRQMARVLGEQVDVPYENLTK